MLTFKLVLLIGQRVLRRAHVGFTLPVGRLERLDLKARCGQLSGGFFDRYPEWRIVQAEKHRPLLDRLIVAHVKLAHPAGDVRAHRHPRGLHIGIVGRFVAAACEIEVAGSGHHHDRRKQHQRHAQPLPKGSAFA